MAKTFVDGMKDWTPQELVFNAVAWDKGYRFFGCSRDLVKVMKWVKVDNAAYTWLSTSLFTKKEGEEIEEILLRKNPTLKIFEENIYVLILKQRIVG